MKLGKKIDGVKIYTLIFGLCLGLAILKFGNPVILDRNIMPPVSASDFLNDPWPTHWANWVFLPLWVIGALISWSKKLQWPCTKWLWLLPSLWFFWQLVSASQTLDANLTGATLWQFFGCLAGYFLGFFLFGREQTVPWLLIGILAAFAFCLVRAVDQRLIEFPQNRQILLEGERTGWTNFPHEIFQEMKNENIIIITNNITVPNPAVLAKFSKGRVNGTLVYPNALAGAILLLFPVSLVLACNSTKHLRLVIRSSVILLTMFLGLAGFFWTESKLAWLIAILISGICLFRLKWAVRLKMVAFVCILLVGLGIFVIRFHNYFSAGATSTSARFDYWRAAVQTTFTHALFGTGPGTFQRSYLKIKSHDAEMARLAHNDYLEQFSDSGIPGGVFYTAWILLALIVVGKRMWNTINLFNFAIFAGLLGWFAQGIGEFSLYIPALAWIAFTLLGSLMVRLGNQIDNSNVII